MMKYIGSFLIAVLFLGFQCQQLALAQDKSVSAEAKLTVLSPMGKPPSITMLAMAPRPKTLKGKTIYIVDDGYVGGDAMIMGMGH